mgnify:CR=1 FL=1
MADFIIDDTVDITDVVCPTTFVKAKVALEELDDGQILSVKMNDGEPVQNVPRSIKEEGHKILKLIDNIQNSDAEALTFGETEFTIYCQPSQPPNLPAVSPFTSVM